MIPIKDNIPTDRFPVVTFLLILANVAVYLLSVRHGGSLIGGPASGEVLEYGAIPYSLTHHGVHCAEFGLVQSYGGARDLGVHCDGQLVPDSGGQVAHVSSAGFIPQWLTVLTSMFQHGSVLHIAGNMLFLWIFGNNVEDSMGRLKFLAFYILGGVAALALQVLVGPNSTAPTIGASGAVAAVLGGYILLYPRARVLTLVVIILFFTVIELPAFVMLGVWFAEQALFGAGDLTNPTGGGGNVAYFAHVGGFAFGLLTVRWLATKRKQVPATRMPAYR